VGGGAEAPQDEGDGGEVCVADVCKVEGGWDGRVLADLAARMARVRAVDGTMGCRGAGDLEDSLTEPRSAGELCARVRREWWEDVKDAAELGGATTAGDGLAN